MSHSSHSKTIGHKCTEWRAVIHTQTISWFYFTISLNAIKKPISSQTQSNAIVNICSSFISGNCLLYIYIWLDVVVGVLCSKSKANKTNKYEWIKCNLMPNDMTCALEGIEQRQTISDVWCLAGVCNGWFNLFLGNNPKNKAKRTAESHKRAKAAEIERQISVDKNADIDFLQTL